MSCVSTHLKILEGAFRTLRPRCLKRLGFHDHLIIIHDPKLLEEEMDREMIYCIKHLQTIYG